MEMKIQNVKQWDLPNLRFTFDLKLPGGIIIHGFRVFRQVKWGKDIHLDVRSPVLNLKGPDGQLKHKSVVTLRDDVQANVSHLFFQQLKEINHGKEFKDSSIE